MGTLKRWVENHIDELTDEELRALGMSDDMIEEWRYWFGESREEHTPL